MVQDAPGYSEDRDDAPRSSEVLQGPPRRKDDLGDFEEIPRSKLRGAPRFKDYEDNLGEVIPGSEGPRKASEQHDTLNMDSSMLRSRFNRDDVMMMQEL